MKKIFLAMCVALVCLNASAQKDEQNVGAHVLYGTNMSNIGLGVKYQYNVTDAIRLEGVGDYYLKKDGFSMWDLNVNGHYLFPISDKAVAYPLIGINYTHWKQDGFVEFDSDEDKEQWIQRGGSDGEMNDGSIGLNIGGGIQYNLTDKIRVGAELKYQTISGYNTAIVSIGVTYTL